MDFGTAMKEWRESQKRYVETHRSNQKKLKISPRQSVTYSIPSIYKNEIDFIIKEFRHKADREFNGLPPTPFLFSDEDEIKKLTFEFEKTNPPPSVREYT